MFGCLYKPVLSVADTFMFTTSVWWQAKNYNTSAADLTRSKVCGKWPSSINSSSLAEIPYRGKVWQEESLANHP